MGFFSAVLAVAVATSVPDEPVSQVPAALAGLAIHHVQISVADADALAAWYVRMLGFRITKRAIAPGLKLIWIDIPGFRLGLAQVDGSVRPASANVIPPTDVMTQGYRQIHFSIADVDLAYATMTKLGARFVMPPRSFAITGIRLATFVDPEGNVGSLYQDLEPGNALIPQVPGRN